jgi:RecB family exonuclease
MYDDDTETSVSDLLHDFQPTNMVASDNPGWHARELATLAGLQNVDDRVPPVTSGEKLSGGASTIQRQLTDPISAFVQSRLGARQLYVQAVGIPPPMRGNLIHDALYKLFIDLPDNHAIQSWEGENLARRIAAAVDFAFARHERQTDAVLQQVFALERGRVAALLRQFVAIDGDRGGFKVASVEGEFEFVAGSIRLPLRFDRIDTFDDGSIAILDYKTGAKKQLLNKDREPQEIQLFVYANATDANVSALALVNIDSREIEFTGAGCGYGDEESWPELLQSIEQQIEDACKNLAAGDVRINIEQGVQSARALNLLSRYTELRREHG